MTTPHEPRHRSAAPARPPRLSRLDVIWGALLLLAGTLGFSRASDGLAVALALATAFCGALVIGAYAATRYLSRRAQ